MMGHQVALSTLDFIAATEGAVARMRASTEGGLDHAVNNRRDVFTRLGDDVRGACAELAVARWLGVRWDPQVNTFGRTADVAGSIEVRSTEHHDGHLILRHRDRVHADRWYVLVTGTPPVLFIRSFIRGRHGIQEQWRIRPEQRWHVPQRAMLHIAPDGSVPPRLRQRATTPA
jgi:hypothetical protein